MNNNTGSVIPIDEGMNSDGYQTSSEKAPSASWSTSSLGEPKPKRLNLEELMLCIVNTDPGIDDAYALCPLITEHKLGRCKILAVIASYGNTSRDNSLRNLHNIMAWFEADDIPIYLGADKSSFISFREEIDYYGQDGFNNVVLNPVQNRTEPQHGANIICDLVNQHPNKISFIELAPIITTLKMAMDLDSRVGANLKEILFLGGTRTGRGTKGVSMVADFNSMNDPEAAASVFERASCPIYLLPKELRNDCCVLSREFRMKMSETNSTQMKALDLLDYQFLSDTKQTHWKKSDLAATCVALNRDMINGRETHYITFETATCKSRALTIIDSVGHSRKPPNCTIITSIDKEMFEKMVLFGAGGPDYQ